MRLRLRVLGRTLFSVTFDGGPAVEYYELETDCGIGGGSGHNFERSIEYYAEPEERGFGFR